MKIDQSMKVTHPIKNKPLNTDKQEAKKENQLKSPKDKIDIALLKEASEKAYNQLRQIVEDLLKRQGLTLDQLGKEKGAKIKVDEKARTQSKAMIEAGGPLSPDQVSARIVNFAKALSNNDKNKFQLLKDAIEDGFEKAKELWGDELPEISKETYKLVQEKLHAWYQE